MPDVLATSYLVPIKDLDQDGLGRLVRLGVGHDNGLFPLWVVGLLDDFALSSLIPQRHNHKGVAFRVHVHFGEVLGLDKGHGQRAFFGRWAHWVSWRAVLAVGVAFLLALDTDIAHGIHLISTPAHAIVVAVEFRASNDGAADFVAAAEALAVCVDKALLAHAAVFVIEDGVGPKPLLAELCACCHTRSV
jgi:hypothetical protein